ncbi:hypothetical protein L596_021718 [Steinernema carpocapsae]|uniref:RNA-directed DNA polymerase n=1 Tax=Steinernema carpocapsae TaxID=34508 RepID=A0A4U5MJM6_STECR|nr:hypothetical protein L596_021718 [Steinernema carpocapsae]
MCVDYRKLNSVTVKDAFPIPKINDLLVSFNSKRYFSTFDLHSGYWQIRMEGDSIDKTAFTTPIGLFEFTVMPFGLTNAVATFQRFMESLFEDVLHDYVFVYVDDILIASETWQEHVHHIEEVLRRIQGAGLRLKAKNKVAPIRDYPEPKNLKELQRFMGLATYNRKFIANFAKIAAPLTRLNKPSVPYVFDNPCHTAFEELKRNICEDVCLKFPDFKAAETDAKRRFVIMTDASEDGLGGVLCQGDENGQLRPILFVSRRCLDAEKKYATIDLEALAIKHTVTAVQQYIQYVRGKTLVLTDHQPLVAIFQKGTCANKRVNRFVSELIPHFQLEIKHIEGKKNVMADALSRATSPSAAEPHWEIDSPTRISVVRHSVNDWNTAIDADPKFGPLKAYLNGSELPKDEKARDLVVAEAPSYCMMEGLLCHVREDGISTKAVPVRFREELLRELHAGPLGVHIAAAKLFEQMRREYFWPTLRADCENICRSCNVCALNRTARNAKPPLESIQTTATFEMLCVDVLKVGLTRAGNVYIVVLIDHFSKYLAAVPVPNKSAATVAQAITTEWILKFGPPSRLHSDQGTEFCNEILKFLCDSFGVIRTTTSPYHPQGNGVTERANRSILAALRKSPTSRFDWDERLGFIIYALNTMTHRTTKVVPFALVFGRNPKLPSVISDEQPHSANYAVDVDTYRALLEESLATLSEVARGNASVVQAENEVNYDARNRARARDFAAGDQVFVRRPQGQVLCGRCAKITPLNEGPFSLRSVGRTSAEVDLGHGKTERFRLERLTKAQSVGDAANNTQIRPSGVNRIALMGRMISEMYEEDLLDYEEDVPATRPPTPGSSGETAPTTELTTFRIPKRKRSHSRSNSPSSSPMDTGARTRKAQRRSPGEGFAEEVLWQHPHHPEIAVVSSAPPPRKADEAKENGTTGEEQEVLRSSGCSPLRDFGQRKATRSSPSLRGKRGGRPNGKGRNAHKQDGHGRKPLISRQPPADGRQRYDPPRAPNRPGNPAHFRGQSRMNRIQTEPLAERPSALGQGPQERYR